MASLDGWNAENRLLLEIKVGNAKDHAAGKVPEKYFPQLQHQMWVTDTKTAYYASYLLGKGVEDTHGDLKIITIDRDDSWLERYIPVAEDFYECLVNNKPPQVIKLKP